MTELCLARGDRVIATMRTPSALSPFTEAEGASYVRSGHLLVLPLDVTSSSAVKTAFTAGLEAFGRIDVVFNNAG
jgi:NAD(P)-dependent dehydrogenase (short-subunit alcohol dehydrogenase family)